MLKEISMIGIPARIAARLRFFALAGALVVCTAGAQAQTQTCLSPDDLDAGARNTLEQTAQRFFDMSKNGDFAGLRSAAVGSLASNFANVESVATQNKPNFDNARASIRTEFVLEAPGNAPIARADFFCGIYNSADRVGFSIPNLPPARYAIVISDISGGKVPMTLSLVLQQEGPAWKLAGYYLHPKEIAGHNGDWYLAQARQFKARGDNYSAWFYYLTAWQIQAPVDFMSTAPLDKLADEMQTARPADLPSQSSPLSVAANGQTFSVTEMTPVPGSDGLQLTVRYKAPNISDVETTRNQNLAVGKALAARFPGFRDAFTQIVSYAVDPQGRAFWTPLPLKEVK
jgi:hypothetical protein